MPDPTPDEWMAAAIRGLPPAHRTALTLVAAQGLRYAEVGEVLDLPAPIVGRLVYEARELLRVASTPDPTLTGGQPASPLPMEDLVTP